MGRSRRRTDSTDLGRFVFLFLLFPVLAALVFVVRRIVLEPYHLVAPQMALFEVVVWAVLVSAAAAACVARRDGADCFAPLTVGLVIGMTTIALLRTHVLHELNLVPEHVTLSEVLTWTFALGFAAAVALAPTTQARIRRLLARTSLPAGARIAMSGAAWVVSVAALCWVGSVVHHVDWALMVVGVINGSIIAIAVLPYVEAPFQSGVTAFLAGITIDNIGGAENTAAARAISAVAGTIQQVAAAVAAQFNASVSADLEHALHASLWTTTGVVVATLVFGMVVASTPAPARRQAARAEAALA
jgi:hypothetical protein